MRRRPDRPRRLARFVFAGVLLLLAARPGLVHAETTVPILTYHNMAANPANRYTISPKRFEEQMRYLKAHGYTPVTVGKAAAFIQGGASAPPKPVVITIDDGYRSGFTGFYPVLRRFGFTASFFVHTDFVGTKNHLTWEQLRALRAHGFEVGSHTRSHPYLYDVSGADLADELETSKAALEGRLGGRVRFLAYPYGVYTEAIEAAVKRAGYEGALTTEAATNVEGDDPFRLKRFTVFRDTTLEEFGDMLSARPLRLDRITPPPGSVVSNQTTVSAVILDRPRSSEAWIKMKSNIFRQVPCHYDERSGLISYRPAKPLDRAVLVIIMVRDKKTRVLRQGSWFFATQKR